MTKKTIKKLIAGGLAFVCAVTASITAIVMGGLTAHDSDNINHNNQTVLGNFFGNGITLTASAAETRAVTLTHGNDYNSAYLDAKNRASIQPYGITIPSGVTLTAKTGYQFGFYSVSNISTPTTASMLGGGWIDTFTTTSDGTYGIAIKKTDDSDFNFSTDSIYIADYIDSTDTTIFGSVSSGSGSDTPSIPSAPAAGAQRLTATITPSSATNQKVDWSVSWKNPTSTWASGKTVTDYVTVTPTSDGALTADVECKQAFGEQVQVTVTSKDNASISASCSVDYAKRIQKITFVNSADGTGTHTTNDSSFIWNVGFDKHIGPYNSPTYEYSLGTIEDTFDFSIMFYVKNDSAILSDIEAETGYSFTINSYANGYDIADSHLEMLTVFNLGAEDEAEVVALKSYFYNHPQTNIFSIKITATGVHSSFEKTLPIYFDPEALRVDITNINLDKSGIVF